jgi:hypothetical protein
MVLPKLRDSVEPMEATIEDSGVQTDTMLHYGRAYEKALMRRVDRRLLPILGALYAVSLVDRVNVCFLNFRDDMAAWAKFDRYPTPELRA